jgi:hypothetical protein
VPERLPISLRQYIRLALAQAFEDFKWGRDLTISTLIALLGLSIQFWEGIPVNYKERKILVLSLVLPYATVFGVHIIWKLFTAPHRLYQKQENQLTESSSKLVAAGEKIKEMEEQGPEVMLSFFYNEHSREYLGISVHNVQGGTAHKIRIKVDIEEGAWLCDFRTIPYLAEGQTTEVPPKTIIANRINLGSMGDCKFISFIRLYDQDKRTDAVSVTVIPVVVTYENWFGTVFEQDFQVSFDKYAGAGHGKTTMLKSGLRRAVRNQE